MPERHRPFAREVFAAELAARTQLAARATPTAKQPAPRARAAEPSSESSSESIVVVLPDQLSLAIGPTARVDPRTTRLVLLESGEWFSRRPYHRQRLAWILLSQRKFALEAADHGYAVEVLSGDEPMVELLRTYLASRGSARCMEPAEREMRAEFAPLVSAGLLAFEPHDGFLTTATDLEAGRTAEGWRMDRFYQAVRRRTGILMEAGKPVGGKFSFDAENRRRWDGTPPAPMPPEFPGSPLREEVASIIETRFSRHPGTLDIAAIPATRAEIDRLWNWAKKSCLPNFGPYEDAMSRRSRGVFHTRISPLMNLHRLLPRQVVHDVAALTLPISSQEGFIRQVLGWREFVYQVHRATDGFRSGRASDEAPLSQPGDGGFARWKGEPWQPVQPAPAGVDGGARPNLLAADAGVPPAYWGAPSGLACLDHVVEDVWAEGWSHHITRLMVLGNLATLFGVSPRELCDWFWIAYIDAWDWVVEPNVLAMATYATSEMTTKPYVSGSAYLEKMGDSCRTCRFTPGKDCPIGPLYWAFLARNNTVLADNPRMKLPLASARGRTDDVRSREAQTFVALRDVLINGKRWEGGSVADVKSAHAPERGMKSAKSPSKSPSKTSVKSPATTCATSSATTPSLFAREDPKNPNAQSTGRARRNP
jgi:deoxyribodipyrimidine photolyase-related protein